MPRISKVYCSKFDLRYGYLFDIRSEDELYEYWRTCRKGQYARMRDIIADRGQIFVNRNGGYFFPLPDHRITDTHDIKAYALPGSKITVSRWPTGTHWYARVGGEDVEYCGRTKWDSHDEALACANLWAKRMGVAIEPE